MNAILNDAHVMAWLAWLKRLEAQLWTLDGFDSHVTDWLAHLPKNREQKQYEHAFPLFENLGELLDERELLKSARKSQDSLGKESTDRLLSRLEDDVRILYSSLGLGPDGKTQSMPLVNDSASGGVEPTKFGPPPLTTGDIAFCFAGLRCKTEEEWKTLIGKGRGWIEQCLVQPGTRGRGGAPKLWSPVCIGAALVRDGHANPNSIRAKFQTVHLLKPWLETWKTYEANNFATE